MLRLSKKTEYALIALKEIALNSGKQVTTAREIAEFHQIPRDLLAKILQVLARNNLIQSTQGAHGGYVLSKPIDEITLLGLLEILEGPAGIVDCLVPGKETCVREEACSIRHELNKVNQRVLDVLRKVTLRNFLYNEMSVAAL